MYKKVNVIILPSKNGNSKIGLNPRAMFNKPHLYYFNEGAVYQECQHLYIISDEEIKVGDWIYRYEDKKVFQSKSYFSEGNPLKKGLITKIIATTDKSITINGYDSSDEDAVVNCYLPQIPQQFIEKWIEEYNKGNQIEEIFVEYVQELSIDSNKHLIEEAYLKINSDNTISIRNKINYSIEEVKEIIRRCAFYFINNPPSNSENILQVSNQWIKENL